MKRLRYLFYFVLAIGVVFTGCTTTESNIQSVTQKDVWTDSVVSNEQLDFYQNISATIYEVDSQKCTAMVTISIPDLEQYLLNPDDSGESSQTVELEFPVHQVDDEWQIASMEPLKEYIRKESTQTLVEAMEESGGIFINFNPQEVMGE